MNLIQSLLGFCLKPSLFYARIGLLEFRFFAVRQFMRLGKGLMMLIPISPQPRTGSGVFLRETNTIFWQWTDLILRSLMVDRLLDLRRIMTSLSCISTEIIASNKPKHPRIVLGTCSANPQHNATQCPFLSPSCINVREMISKTRLDTPNSKIFSAELHQHFRDASLSLICLMKQQQGLMSVACLTY